MTDYSRKTTRIQLVIEDPDAGERHKVEISVPLNDVQSDSIDTAQVMSGTNLAAIANGPTVDLIHGRLRLPVSSQWKDWWAAAKLQDCSGPQALAALRAFAIFSSAKKGRGERGPNKDSADRNDFMIAAVLVRLARGMSRRAAVESALIEFEPESRTKDSEALMRSVTRYLSHGHD